MRIAIGSDHAGRHLGLLAVSVVKDLHYQTIEFIPNDGVSVDYPDSAVQVAEAVAKGQAEMGILVCGTGVGMAMTANKIRGVRAAVVHDAYTAKMSRQHNDANVLCLGERVLGSGVAEECMRVFLQTSFEGGRHSTRVDKIKSIEDKQ